MIAVIVLLVALTVWAVFAMADALREARAAGRDERRW